MKHEEILEMMTLFLYGELSEEEAKRLEDHLATCPECRKELEDLRRLHGLLQKQTTQPSEHLLFQARNELFRRLRRGSESSAIRSAWQRILHPVSTVSWNWMTAGGAVALVCLGFFIGYLSFATDERESHRLAALDPFGSSGPRIANVTLEETDEVTGQVRLTFDAVREVQLQGNLEDRRIQRFLAYALINEQNPGVRLRAVNTIRDQASAKLDQEIRRALIVALRGDANAAVRKQALMVLKKYPLNTEIKEALLYALVHDENAGVRIEAINALEEAYAAGATPGQEVVGILERKLDTDDNKYIRLRAKAVLEEIKPQYF